LLLGSGTLIADEGVAIYEAVREQVEANQTELKGMEEAVKEQLGGKPKKKKKKKKTAGKKGSSDGNTGLVGDVDVNLGDLDFNFSDVDSDSDDGGSAGLLDL
jgi:hypothetical protein